MRIRGRLACERRRSEGLIPGDEAVVRRWSSAHDAFEHADGYAAESEARRIAASLNIEDRILDRVTGHMVNPNMEWYLLPGMSDIPKIDIMLMNQPERGALVTEYSVTGAVQRQIGVLRRTGHEADPDVHLAFNTAAYADEELAPRASLRRVPLDRAVDECGPGDMVLFPSYLMHAVPPNAGERRVTLSFNAIPTRLDSWGYIIGFSGLTGKWDSVAVNTPP